MCTLDDSQILWANASKVEAFFSGYLNNCIAESLHSIKEEKLIESRCVREWCQQSDGKLLYREIMAIQRRYYANSNSIWLIGASFLSSAPPPSDKLGMCDSLAANSWCISHGRNARNLTPPLALRTQTVPSRWSTQWFSEGFQCHLLRGKSISISGARLWKMGK